MADIASGPEGWGYVEGSTSRGTSAEATRRARQARKRAARIKQQADAQAAEARRLEAQADQHTQAATDAASASARDLRIEALRAQMQAHRLVMTETGF